MLKIVLILGLVIIVIAGVIASIRAVDFRTFDTPDLKDVTDEELVHAWINTVYGEGDYQIKIMDDLCLYGYIYYALYKDGKFFKYDEIECSVARLCYAGYFAE